MAKLGLPLPEQALQDAHERSRDGAMKVFDEQHFGRHHAKKSVMQLDEEIEKVLTALCLWPIQLHSWAACGMDEIFLTNGLLWSWIEQVQKLTQLSGP